MRTQRSLQGVQVSASRRSGATDELGPDKPERNGPTNEDTEDIEDTVNTEDTEGTEGSMESTDSGGSDLLAALLDGMDAALCAFDVDGVVTHWNREAERILGAPAEDAFG
ncbi:PAS domain-containing protein, partial [Streptomyces caniscabiei]|uniref:PAS domain-containing protein n=1 Tax=Streptomyces caniscabiei TaxID=2746961 RepID=UPI001F4585C3